MAFALMDEEYAYVRHLRKGLHALQKIEPGFFSPIETIFFGCPDFRRLWDILNHQAHLCGCGEIQNLPVHLPLWHGGVARLDPDSELNIVPGSSEVFWAEAKAAMDLTGIKQVLALTHFPCGWARERGVKPEALLRSHEIGFKRLQAYAEDRGIIVYPTVHVAYGDLAPGGNKTYLADFDKALLRAA
ncbi:MAG TPA: hypothetical protein VMC43_00755 [Candidatus Paceibacterota bacterium]|nr:hypothetical protein [Candidatus Paceibacterota bacterium]